ncbi:MAG: response regulator [Tistlia sp.]
MSSIEAAQDDLVGRRVLIVEDETVVALMIEDMLDDLGYQLAGSLASLEKALEAAQDTDADVALLDVNIGGKEIFPVAERLRQRGIPLIFATGYGNAGLPAAWRDVTVLAKPFVLEDLSRALGRALAGAARG